MPFLFGQKMITDTEKSAMRSLLTGSMTATAEHRNNPTGAAATSSVATGIEITPINSTSSLPTQDYPIEKLFLLRETFTAYTAFKSGDFLVSGGITYAIRAVHKSEISLGVFYYLILEKQIGD
jgi:hypothetical protein